MTTHAIPLLHRLAKLAEQAGLSTVAAELVDDRIPALESGRVSVVVLGEFNHGKSTLINGLLGDEVLPMGITPTTALITRILHAPQSGVTVHYRDGSADRTVSLTELNEVIREDNDRIEHVEVFHPAKLLDEQVMVVDTPGVNDISQQRVEVTYGIVPRADVILFVLDATQVLKKTELRFIEKRLLTGLRERLIFAINKADRLDAEELEEVQRYARERLEALLGPVDIFPLSAKRAMREGDEGFDRLRAHLEDFLRRRRDQILLDSAISTGLRSGSVLLGSLQIKRRGYLLEREELETRISTVREKLQESRRAISENLARIEDSTEQLTATARHNLQDFRDAFLAALPREIEKVAADDVQKHLPGFIEDCFRRFLEHEGRALAKALESLAEEIIAITNENIRETVDTLQEELGVNPEDLDIRIDTTAYDVSVFALGAFGVSILLFINAIVGGLIALATPVLAFVLKDKLEGRIKAKATEVGLETIQAASVKAEEELVRLVDDFGSRLRSFVEDAGDRLYRQINETLSLVLTERKGENFDQAALTEGALATESAVREVVTTLRSMREALWGDVTP